MYWKHWVWITFNGTFGLKQKYIALNPILCFEYNMVLSRQLFWQFVTDENAWIIRENQCGLPSDMVSSPLETNNIFAQ